MTDSEIVEKFIEIRHDLSEGKYHHDVCVDGDTVGEEINRPKLVKDLTQFTSDITLERNTRRT